MRWVVTWSEVALDQYLALNSERKALILARLAALTSAPDGEGCRYVKEADIWSTTDAPAAGFLVYTFRRSAPRLVVLRLVYP